MLKNTKVILPYPLPILDFHITIFSIMSAYERFDTEQNGSAVSVELSVPESESATAGGQASSIEDVQIKVDKQIEAEKDGHLTIYTEENKSGIEYIDDPSKDIPKDALGSVLFQMLQMHHVYFNK